MSKKLLWTGLRPLSKEGELSEKIQMPSVFKSLNYIAFIVCILYPIFIFLSGNMKMNFWSISTCLLPAFLCIIVIFLLRIKKLGTAMFTTFILVPIAITIKANFEPVGGIMLYPLAQSIVCFFVLRNKIQIITVYLTSILCFSEINIYYEYRISKSLSQELIFLIIGLVLFIVMLYFIFSYVRNTIEEYHTVTTINQRELSGKNNVLKIQNTLIRKQSNQLEKKQKLLIEAADLHQRISSLLSHDIRASVMSYKNIFASYRKGAVSKEEFLGYIPVLEKEADNMNTLFEDILSLSKEQNMSDEQLREKIDPQVLIKEICLAYNGIADNKNIGLHYYISSSNLVYVNPKFVRIILRNLVSNAIKFTQPGGNICISSSIKDGGSYKILVQDNGEGMSAEKLEKIRKGVGLTTKGTSNENGTGLGLSFCREFVSKCGGILEVQSELGKGTTFSFTLPLADYKAFA